jgi:hypothetical protein
LQVLGHRCSGGGVEGGEILQGGGPDLAPGGVGDQDGVVALDHRHVPDGDAGVEKQRCGGDGGGRGALRVVQQDAVALLADVELVGGGVEAAVEGPGLIVEMPDEAFGGVGDPDAAVVEIHLGGWHSLMDQRESGQRRQQQTDDTCLDAASCEQQVNSPVTVIVWSDQFGIITSGAAGSSVTTMGRGPHEPPQPTICRSGNRLGMPARCPLPQYQE